MLLSERTTTAVVTGGYLHIIIPDAGSESGFSSYRIAVTDLLSGIKIDELYQPDGTNPFVYTDNNGILNVDGGLEYNLTLKTVTNAGGIDEASATTLTVDKQVIIIEATNSNRFYKLPSGATDGQQVRILAETDNTADVAIITTNTNLTANKGLNKRDSISFISSGGVWLSYISLQDN